MLSSIALLQWEEPDLKWLKRKKRIMLEQTQIHTETKHDTQTGWSRLQVAIKHVFKCRIVQRSRCMYTLGAVLTHVSVVYWKKRSRSDHFSNLSGKGQ